LSGRAHQTTGALTLADLAPLFSDPPEAPRARLQWPHSPFAFWLASTRPEWRIAGTGAAFDEVCALIVEAKRPYEPVGPASPPTDLLVLDGPWDEETVDFGRWQPLLAPGAIVLIHGIHAGYGGRCLWRQWLHDRPASPIFTLSAGQGLGLGIVDETLAPPVISALFALSVDDAAAFQQICRSAAARWEAASREAEAQRRGAWLARSQLRAVERQKEGLHDAICEIAAERAVLSAERANMKAVLSAERANMNTVLSAERAKTEHLAHRVAAMEASNTWRAGMALQRIPAPARTILRRAAQAIWWTVTGQLARRLRARRASFKAAKQPASDSGTGR
jgi:hypothetical protein